MPRVRLISDESKQPLISNGYECAAKIIKADYQRGVEGGDRPRNPTVEYTFDLLSPDSLKGDDGEIYPLQGRKHRQKFFLTDKAAFRLEPLLQATDSQYEKTSIAGKPKQFTLDFDTESPVGKIVWVKFGVREFLGTERDDETGMTKQAMVKVNEIDYRITKPAPGAIPEN